MSLQCSPAKLKSEWSVPGIMPAVQGRVRNVLPGAMAARRSMPFCPRTRRGRPGTMCEVQLLAAINTIGRLPCLEIRVRGDMLEYPAGSGRLVRSGETVTVDGPFAAWRICLRMRQRRWPGFEPTDPQLLAYWAAFIAYTDR